MKEYSHKEIVTVEITQNVGIYFTKAKWISVDMINPHISNVIASAESTNLSENWGSIIAVESSDNYRSIAKILIDGQMVETAYGYGPSINVFITPKNEMVHAKGIFSWVTEESHFEVPFEGEFILGDETTIYERIEHYEKNAYAEPEYEPDASEYPIDNI